MRLEEKEYTKSFDYSIWKRIFPFLKPYKKTVIMILVMNLFCSLVDIILPLFQRYAINHFIEGNTLTGIGFFTVLYIVVIALSGCGGYRFYPGQHADRDGPWKGSEAGAFRPPAEPCPSPITM